MYIALFHLVLDQLEFLHDVIEVWLHGLVNFWELAGNIILGMLGRRLATEMLKGEMESSSVAMLAYVSLPKKNW